LLRYPCRKNSHPQVAFEGFFEMKNNKSTFGTRVLAASQALQLALSEQTHMT
jgi:hypothetical protein